MQFHERRPLLSTDVPQTENQPRRLIIGTRHDPTSALEIRKDLQNEFDRVVAGFSG